MRILFVCLGNICRSPAAEAACRAVLSKKGLDHLITVDSAGTSGWHQGEPSDARMARAAAGRSIMIAHRSRKFTRRDFDAFDLIFAMDRENLDDLLALAGSQEWRSKVQLFRDYDPEGSGDVPDPYYGGREGFDRVIDIIERTCENLASKLEEKLRDRYRDS